MKSFFGLRKETANGGEPPAGSEAGAGADAPKRRSSILNPYPSLKGSSKEAGTERRNAKPPFQSKGSKDPKAKSADGAQGSKTGGKKIRGMLKANEGTPHSGSVVGPPLSGSSHNGVEYRANSDDLPHAVALSAVDDDVIQRLSVSAPCSRGSPIAGASPKDGETQREGTWGRGGEGEGASSGDGQGLAHGNQDDATSEVSSGTVAEDSSRTSNGNVQDTDQEGGPEKASCPEGLEPAVTPLQSESIPPVHQSVAPQTKTRSQVPGEEHDKEEHGQPGRKIISKETAVEIKDAITACGEDDEAAQLRGASSLRSLSRGQKETRIAIVEAGGVEALLHLHGSQNEEILSMVLFALLNVSFDDESVHQVGVPVPFLEAMLNHPSQAISETAAGIVFSLSRHDDHREALLSPQIVRPLVNILDGGSRQGKRDSCKALFHLSYLPDSYPLLIAEGTVQPAVALLEPPDSKIAEKATCLLANIARCPEGCHAIMEEDAAITRLVEILDDGSPLAKEYSAAALLLIAKCDETYKKSLFQESPFIGLNFLVNAGTARARSKAGALLKLLRDEDGK